MFLFLQLECLKHQISSLQTHLPGKLNHTPRFLAPLRARGAVACTLPIPQPLASFVWSVHCTLHKRILLGVPEISDSAPLSSPLKSITTYLPSDLRALISLPDVHKSHPKITQQTRQAAMAALASSLPTHPSRINNATYGSQSKSKSLKKKCQMVFSSESFS